MLTEGQKEAVEQAGVEVATLRLAAVSKLEPQVPIIEYGCKPPPEKRDVESWLNKTLKRQRTAEMCLGLIIVSLVGLIAGGAWELLFGL
jgi:hypothetical protein